MDENSPPALLLTTWSDTEAAMVRELLATYGIRCSVSSEVPHSVLPLTVDGLGAVRLHVSVAVLGEARAILAAHRSAGSSPPSGGTTKGLVVPMPVRVESATRIDLAGGTLDIWPLYLFLEDPVTVNMAIDLMTVAEVGVLPGSLRITLQTDDLGQTVRATSTAELDLNGPLGLLARLVAFFRPQGGVRVRTAASVPAGSGLGGSSALAVAVAVGLQRLAGQPAAGHGAPTLARELADLEAQVLGVPTGIQDHFPALLGGVQQLSFGPGQVRTRRLPVSMAAVTERLVLVYEGATRSSGISNFDMVRRFLEGERTARDGLAGVARASGALAQALERGDLDAAGEAMEAEMTSRRQLSPAVLTPITERLFTVAHQEGALAAKVCGAGGGGCSVYWVRAGRREAVGHALEKAGARLLPFNGVEQGLVTDASLPDNA